MSPEKDVRSLRDRLQTISPAPAEPASRSATRDGFGVELAVPGIERVNQFGSHFLTERVVPATQFEPLATLPAISSGSLMPDWPSSARISPLDLLFLDTETTGLAGGAGTHAFMIGVGYFSSGAFNLRQFFMREMYEEPSILVEIQNMLGEFAAVVTFNGKSFDWPLLESRLILHGYRDFGTPMHWDLLHPARRIWRHRLRDCSLGNLESRLFNITRHDDVPGFLIPSLYFDYLRRRDARPLRPVFHHNAEDIITLARLANKFLQIEGNPVDWLTHPTDAIAYGLLQTERGDRDAGIALLERALESSDLEPHLEVRAIEVLSREHKRAGRHARAAQHWQRLLLRRDVEPVSRITACVEMAKYHEHQRRDVSSAIAQTERALRTCELAGLDQMLRPLIHRLARLTRKRAGRPRNHFEEAQ